jgi:hypothetical protein
MESRRVGCLRHEPADTPPCARHADETGGFRPAPPVTRFHMPRRFLLPADMSHAIISDSEDVAKSVLAASR